MLKSGVDGFGLLKETLSEFFNFPDQVVGFELFADSVDKLKCFLNSHWIILR